MNILIPSNSFIFFLHSRIIFDTTNVQKVAVNVNGAKKRMHVCTSCLRSGKVERAI